MRDTCGCCRWFIVADCERVEILDGTSATMEFGICSNVDGEYYDGFHWRNLSNHSHYMRIRYDHVACKHFCAGSWRRDGAICNRDIQGRIEEEQ